MISSAAAMLTFHASLHRRPPRPTAGGAVMLSGAPYAAIDWRPSDAGLGFEIAFESAAVALAALEGMFCEPDGAFVWRSRGAGPPWQVDGVLYDRAGRLLYVDLKGACPPERFDQLLRAVGWPDAGVMFQITAAAVFLDEAEFRRWAGRAQDLAG